MEHDLKEINVPSNPEIEKLQQQVIAIVVVSRSKQTNPLNYAKASFPPSTMSLPPVHNIWSILSSFCACYRVSVLCLHSYFFFVFICLPHISLLHRSRLTLSIPLRLILLGHLLTRLEANGIGFQFSSTFTPSVSHHRFYII